MLKTTIELDILLLSKFPPHYYQLKKHLHRFQILARVERKCWKIPRHILVLLF
jgi:hypothetical protein